MTKTERQAYILSRVMEQGTVTTNDLVSEFGLAEDTIRKDFQSLAGRGLVRRFHGGVMRLDDDVTPFASRTMVSPVEKGRLAQRTVELIGAAHVLYIDGGTTNLKFAEALSAFAGTALTNSPAIALALCAHLSIAVALIGGTVDNTTQTVSGADAIQQIQQLSFECCVLGVSHLDPEAGITFPSSSEAALKREVMEHSQRVIAIALKEKLGVRSTFFAKDLSALDVLVTNESDEDVLAAYRAFGIEVVSEPVGA